MTDKKLKKFLRFLILKLDYCDNNYERDKILMMIKSLMD